MLDTYINFLIKYFSLFEAQIIEVHYDGGVFKGTVLYNDSNYSIDLNNISEKPWEDEDFRFDFCQDFHWKIENSLQDIKYFTKILDFISEKKLNDNDKIMLSVEDFQKSLKELGWNEFEINEFFEKFFNFGIDMVDDGELSDCWYFHL